MDKNERKQCRRNLSSKTFNTIRFSRSELSKSWINVVFHVYFDRKHLKAISIFAGGDFGTLWLSFEHIEWFCFFFLHFAMLLCRFLINFGFFSATVAQVNRQSILHNDFFFFQECFFPLDATSVNHQGKYSIIRAFWMGETTNAREQSKIICYREEKKSKRNQQTSRNNGNNKTI